MHHRAGDADALLLAGGQFAGKLLGLVRQRHPLESGADTLADLHLGQAENLQRQGHVVEHATVEQKLVVLEHHADLPAQVGNLGVGDLPQILAGQQQLAGGRSLHRQQQAQQGALAGTRVTGDEQKLAAAHAKAQFVQPDVTVGVTFTDLLELDHYDSLDWNSAWTKELASKVRRSSIDRKSVV